jgi:hypothetical protein
MGNARFNNHNKEFFCIKLIIKKLFFNELKNIIDILFIFIQYNIILNLKII